MRSLLPHGDPFGEPGQVTPGRDAQRGLERPAGPTSVSFVLVTEPQDHSGAFGEQVAAAVRDLPQFGERRLNVERVPDPRGGSQRRRDSP